MKSTFCKLTAILLLLVTLIGSLPVVVLAADAPVLWVSPLEGEPLEERPISSVKWWYDDDDAVYYLFLPTACNPESLQLWLDNALFCAVDGYTVDNGSAVALLTVGAHTVTINDTDYPVVVMQSANIGTMYITTESGSMNYIHKAKGNKESGAMKMLDAEG
ncbi:MAG: hypothetical protein IJN34_04005, partial [Clostridia bacterium]|nr:hypothetical protein [Clostridia bacterium]